MIAMRFSSLALVLVLASAAQGEEAPPAAPAQVLDPDTEIAHGHFMRGQDFYEHSQYREALVEFQAALQAKKLAAFQFNIGKCYEKLEQFDEAIAAYQAFVDGSVGKDAVDGRKRIEEIRVRQRAKEFEAPPPAVVDKTSPASADTRTSGERPWLRRHLGPALLGAGAIVVGLVGTGLVLSVGPSYSALDTGPTACAPRCAPSTYEGLRTTADAGYAMWGVAGVLAIVDVVLWVAGSGKSEGAATARWMIAPAANGLVAAGRF